MLDVVINKWSLIIGRVTKAIAENKSDILDGGNFVGVVNAPDLGAIRIAKQEHIVSIQGKLIQGYLFYHH